MDAPAAKPAVWPANRRPELFPSSPKLSPRANATARAPSEELRLKMEALKASLRPEDEFECSPQLAAELGRLVKKPLPPVLPSPPGSPRGGSEHSLPAERNANGKRSRLQPAAQPAVHKESVLSYCDDEKPRAQRRRQ